MLSSFIAQSLQSYGHFLDLGVKMALSSKRLFFRVKRIQQSTTQGVVSKGTQLYTCNMSILDPDAAVNIIPPDVKSINADLRLGQHRKR